MRASTPTIVRPLLKWAGGKRQLLPVLAEHFLSVYWRKHRGKGSDLPTFSKDGMYALKSRHWAGNVRELQNVMEHAVVLLDPGQSIGPDDLPEVDESPMGNGHAPVRGMTLAEHLEGEYHTVRERVIADFELQYLCNLIERAGANMSRAAKMAGVDRTTLYRLMEKHGVQRDTVIKTS